jgi:hypothetical protein
MRSAMSIRLAVSKVANRLEQRGREIAMATARRCMNWILHELAHNPDVYRIVDDIVDYLVRNPEVEELVRRQSATLVGQAVDELRMGAERADSALDRVVLALRRRLRRR